jgi:hypothetical protein
MGTLTGILATAAVSHLSGSAIGGILARFGLFGFGSKLKIARHVLRVGKALRAAFDQDDSTAARSQLQDWLAEHDPRNETGLGDGIGNAPTGNKEDVGSSSHVSTFSD